MASVPEVIARYFHGVNNEDWEDFRGVWHEQAEVEVVGGVRVQGWDEILAYYVRALSGFPVHHDDPYGVHVAGDTVTVEIAFSGETAEGVPATFEAVDVFTLENGRVRRLTTWYDLDRVIGFLHAPGAPERRLRTLVRHAASSSPFYRRVFEELSLDPESVASDLSRLPVTRLEGVALEALVAVPEREITAVVGTLPLSRADIRQRGRIWGDALALAGVGPGDTVLGPDPSPGLAEGVGAVCARLAFTTGLAAPAVTVVVGHTQGATPVGSRARLVTVLELPETGVVASPCGRGELHAHTGSHVVEIAAGELIVTPLGARAVPLVRLGTGIGATWLEEPCPCGSTLPTLRLTEHGE